MAEHVPAGPRRGWLPKQPLVPAALLFALGVVLQDALAAPPDPALFLAGGAALAWFLVSWRALRPPWPVAPLLLVAGMMAAAAQLAANRDDAPGSLRALVLRVPQRVSLRGVVATDPAWRETEDRPVASAPARAPAPPGPRAEFALRVSSVRFHTQWEPARGRVQVRLRLPAADAPAADAIEFGREVEVEGVLDRPREARNFGLFDHAEYLARQGIGFTLAADGPGAARVLGEASGWGWLFRARRELGRRLTLGIEDDPLACGIIRGMLLGYREDIPPDVNDAFRRTGTLHVFAISGSHITAIALALLVALRAGRVPRAAACWVVLPILAFYVAATGLRASAVRSLVMAAIVIAGWALRRPAALLNNLAAAALVVLAADPLQLFDAGFQLSFGVVAALIFLAPAFDARLRAAVDPDPWIPRKLVPRWRTALSDPLHWATGLLAVSLAAWIGSLGLNVHYFNLVSFVALLANLLVVPLAAASVALGLVSLALGALWDPLALTLNATHALLVHLMAGISAELGSWRAGAFCVARPPVAWTVAGYALLAAAAKLWLDGRRLRALATLASLASLAALAAAAAWLDPRVRVDVLDVGTGQAALVTGPRLERVLVDAGSRSEGRNTVVPFLRVRGVNALDLVVVTHGDAGHYGGLAGVLDAFPVRRLAVSSAAFRSRGYRDLLADLKAREVPAERWRAKDGADLRSGRLDALWPPDRFAPERADDGALVLRLETPFGDVLFASDIGDRVEADLVAAGRLRPCRLLVQGPPAAGDYEGAAFLAACRPEAAVVNTAEFPLRALPSADLRARWERAGVSAFPTDARGGVVALLGPEGLRVEARRSP
jgi:competence protein ComEC